MSTKSLNDFRVVRGGSWYFGTQGTRAAYRYRDAAASRYISLGFRLAEDMHCNCGWRVVRGASWGIGSQISLSAYRLRYTAAYRSSGIGFRLVEDDS